MKTITEFSGSVLRSAARVLRAGAPTPAVETAPGDEVPLPAAEPEATVEGGDAPAEAAAVALAGGRAVPGEDAPVAAWAAVLVLAAPEPTNASPRGTRSHRSVPAGS